MSNKEQGVDQAIKVWKAVGVNPIYLGVKSMSEACRDKTPKKGVIRIGGEVYIHHYHPPTSK